MHGRGLGHFFRGDTLVLHGEKRVQVTAAQENGFANYFIVAEALDLLVAAEQANMGLVAQQGLLDITQ